MARPRACLASADKMTLGFSRADVAGTTVTPDDRGGGTEAAVVEFRGGCCGG